MNEIEAQELAGEAWAAGVKLAGQVTRCCRWADELHDEIEKRGALVRRLDDEADILRKQRDEARAEVAKTQDALFLLVKDNNAEFARLRKRVAKLSCERSVNLMRPSRCGACLPCQCKTWLEGNKP